MFELPMKFIPSINIKKINAETISTKMQHDKKAKGGKIQFILLKDFGEMLVDVPIDNKSIKKALRKTEQIWFKRATAGL